MAVINQGPDATQWYLRSMSDYDTHRGQYCITTSKVRTICGIEFVPIPTGWRGDRLALTGKPPDPEQICSHCHQDKRPKPENSA
jgi:hypothetical protein